MVQKLTLNINPYKIEKTKENDREDVQSAVMHVAKFVYRSNLNSFVPLFTIIRHYSYLLNI